MANAVPKPLNKSNYSYWRDMMTVYLKSQDLWAVVSEQGPTEDDLWKIKDAKALHAIMISCEEWVFDKIRDKRTAKEAWTALESDFDPSHKRREALRLGTPSTSTANVSQPDVENADQSYKDLAYSLSRRGLNEAIEWCRGHPDLLKQRLPNSRNPPVLHELIMLAGYRREGIVVEMLRDYGHQLPGEDINIALDMKNSSGDTPLIIAAQVGAINIAKLIVGIKPSLLSEPNDFGLIPVIVALYSHNSQDMVEFLYSRTPEYVWSLENGKYGATLITKSLELRKLDLALRFLENFPELVLHKDINGISPVYAAACAPDLFCTKRLGFWPFWIRLLRRVSINLGTRWHRDSINLGTRWDLDSISLGTRSDLDSLNLGTRSDLDSLNLGINISAIRFLEDMEIGIRDSGLVYDAFFEAIRRGNFNFIVMLMKANIQISEERDDMSRNIYMCAIEYRQAEIFSLIFWEKDAEQVTLSANLCHDKWNNNLLHMAATLAPSTAFDGISGPGLQLQGELRWFKEVEKLVPPSALTFKNSDGMTPRELFTENHKDLVVAGEKWMKDTAYSCTIIAPLIITIMFAAAFQIPGGNNQDTGFPIFLNKKLFMLYMVSVATSLFSATTSVLVFLKILTSNYGEEDFFTSLPRKMIIGLSTLFLSLASMIIAFCSGLFLTLDGELGILIPIVTLAAFPVGYFVRSQFPLLVEIFNTTYRQTIIFDRKIGMRYTWE